MTPLVLLLSLTTGAALTYALRVRRSRLSWIERYSAARHRAERAERALDQAVSEAARVTAGAAWLGRLKRDSERRAN